MDLSITGAFIEVRQGISTHTVVPARSGTALRSGTAADALHGQWGCARSGRIGIDSTKCDRQPSPLFAGNAAAARQPWASQSLSERRITPPLDAPEKRRAASLRPLREIRYPDLWIGISDPCLSIRPRRLLPLSNRDAKAGKIPSELTRHGSLLSTATTEPSILGLAEKPSREAVARHGIVMILVYFLALFAARFSSSVRAGFFLFSFWVAVPAHGIS